MTLIDPRCERLAKMARDLWPKHDARIVERAGRVSVYVSPSYPPVIEVAHAQDLDALEAQLVALRDTACADRSAK